MRSEGFLLLSGGLAAGTLFVFVSVQCPRAFPTTLACMGVAMWIRFWPCLVGGVWRRCAVVICGDCVACVVLCRWD